MNNDQLVHQLKEIVAEIPFGHIATVEELTESLELTKDMEDTVTWAVKSIKDDTVPTWRVVRDDGSLVYTDDNDQDTQRQLLQKEKVSFDDTGKVAVHDHFWSACEYVRAQ